MKGRCRFYCLECGHFIDRRMVEEGYDYRFYCRMCSSPVIRTDKIDQSMKKDYIDYLNAKGTDMEEFM